MNISYQEVTGTVAFVKEQLGFVANRLWLRHIAGNGVIEVSIAAPYNATHIKLLELTAGLQGVHPNEVLIETVEGISTIAVKGNGLKLAIRATQ